LKTQLELGAQLETLTRGELSEELAAQTQQFFAEYARGMKYMRFGPFGGNVAAAAISFDGSQQSGTGPRGGYVWSIRRIDFAGLTAGTTPDVINLYRNNPQGRPVWQFNGNNWSYTFGKTEMLLFPGETLSFANLGALAATGQITMAGDFLEIPAEQIFKLF